MAIIAITGATGNMGMCLIPSLMELVATDDQIKLRLLLRPSKKNVKLAKKLCKRHKNVKVYFSSIQEPLGLLDFVKDIDYCVHMAAIIPPRSDYDEEETYNTNYLGTKNLIDAIVATGGRENCKFIHIGTVAEYGNRTPRHPFGRVGDPLMPSTFDVYATTKVKAERYVIESELEQWVVLRQTGVLYDIILLNNMNDGLMFHTPLNCPIEWVTAEDSANLITGLIRATEEGKFNSYKIYKKIYNIGGGIKMRTTGFETLDAGFRLMGCSVKDIFLPSWIAKRNFHCMWFLDSYKLQELTSFQNTSFNEFFEKLQNKYWYFKLAKPFLALVKFFVVHPLLKNKNSPSYWKNQDVERYEVFCGINETRRNTAVFPKIKDEWGMCKLFCENITEDGEKIDYQACKNETCEGRGIAYKLDHGFDDAKDDCEIGIEDARSAAIFRGGELVSGEMRKGDLTTKLEWRCHKGHVFKASPCLILRGGHWCPECTDAPPWAFGELAKDVPFYAQIYYDDHDERENKTYKEHPLSRI